MIEFISVSKRYNDLAALEDISFEIEEREFTFFVGPSGSGKTTIIKLLIKKEDPSKGNIFFFDTDIAQLRGAKISQLRREIGVVFQDFKLLPNKNVAENLAFPLEVAGKKTDDIEETVAYILELVGLKDRANSFPFQLSGGEQQKIAIARAIANNPKLLIADEPTGNLDPHSSWEIIELLTKINEWGTTVIMATHGSDIVNKLGKRVIELDQGKIISDNKKGAYPQRTITIEQPTQVVQERKKRVRNDRDKQKERKQPSTPTPPEKPIEEKEFDITFTTKAQAAQSKKKKKKKQHEKRTETQGPKTTRKGKDVVDLHTLKLPHQIEEILIQSDITTIKQLRTLSKEQLCAFKGIGKKSAQRIKQALRKGQDSKSAEDQE